MGIAEEYNSMAAMASSSLNRLGRLAIDSLGVSTLAVYVKSAEGSPRRVFAMPNYPAPSEAEGQLVQAFVADFVRDDRAQDDGAQDDGTPKDDVEVVEAANEHPKLVDHQWVDTSPGWRFVASAPLVVSNPVASNSGTSNSGASNSGAAVGYLIVADDQPHALDVAARATFVAKLSDWAATIIERLKLQQSQAEVAAEMDRMITIGVLAAGVAHEINNPLSFVGGNIQFALRLLQDDFCDSDLPAHLSSSVEEISDALQDALVGSRRVHDVVKDLHRLGGGGNHDDFTIEPITVLTPLKGSLNIARKHIEQRARLVTDFDDVAEVMGNRSKLGQVFLNLLMNAAQAIPKGQAQSNEVRVSTYIRDDDVVVSISDTGTGISDENLSLIFEPFFTTKSRNEGTGLGLSISHNIVATMSGDIEIETTPGEGTTFKVVLPSIAKMLTGLPNPV